MFCDATFHAIIVIIIILHLYKVLCLEWKKNKPNTIVIADLMRRTYVVRRQKILSTQLSMGNLLKTYPPLQQYKQVCMHLICLLV